MNLHFRGQKETEKFLLIAGFSIINLWIYDLCFDFQ